MRSMRIQKGKVSDSMQKKEQYWGRNMKEVKKELHSKMRNGSRSVGERYPFSMWKIVSVKRSCRLGEFSKKGTTRPYDIIFERRA